MCNQKYHVSLGMFKGMLPLDCAGSYNVCMPKYIDLKRLYQKNYIMFYRFRPYRANVRPIGLCGIGNREERTYHHRYHNVHFMHCTMYLKRGFHETTKMNQIDHRHI